MSATTDHIIAGQVEEPERTLPRPEDIYDDGDPEGRLEGQQRRMGILAALGILGPPLHWWSRPRSWRQSRRCDRWWADWGISA